MLNIGQVRQALAGEIKVSDVRTAEWKAGQIVRGVVLEWLGEGEALLLIDGVKVKAALQHAARPGQWMSFLVLPESSGGQLVLQAADPLAPPAGGPALLLEQLGLADIPEHRNVLAAMQREGVPLTKDAFLALKTMLDLRPAALPQDQWMQAAAAAARKGLPVNREVTGALYQVLFGPPLGKLLDHLLMQLAMFRPNGTEKAEIPAEQLSRLYDQLQRMRSELSRSGSPAPQSLPPAAGAPDSGRTAVPGLAGTDEAGKAVRTDPSGRGIHPEQPGTAVPSERSGSAAGGERILHGSGLYRAQPQPEQEPAAVKDRAALLVPKLKTADAAASDPAAPAGSAGSRAQGSALQTAAGGAAADESRSPSGSVSPPVSRTDAAYAAAVPDGNGPGRAEGSWILRLLRLLGADTEHVLLRRVETPGTSEQPPSPVHEEMPGMAGSAADRANADGRVTGLRAGLDNLKTVLFQLQAAEELPLALRETAQQALQHISGQQLLLSPDRSGTFTTLTLLLPVYPGQDGQRPAAVHIQSRKKNGREPLDADNCRLIFDLHLNHLGDLFIDVQVIDRFVNVILHSGHPRLKQWVEEEKPAFEEALAALGYRCAQLKCVPFPNKQAATPERGGSNAEGLQWEHMLKPYKGVDIRL